jgi:GNAT superfamily N-acetyltransferase
MDPTELAVAGDLNLAGAWGSFARHAASGVSELEAITLVSTGLPIAFFNGAFLRGTPASAEATLEATLGFFTEHGVPYLLWAREAVGAELLTAGRAAGLRDAGGVPGMGLPSIGTPPAAPAELELRLATTAAELAEHRAVVSQAFGVPVEIFEQVIVPTVVDDPQMAVAVGRVDGTAVVTAFLFVSGETAGVYNVATLPDHRSKGYGAAATWAVIAEGARRGCTHAVLQSSQKGYPVYQRMGFVDLGRYVQLEGPPKA